MNSKFNKTYDEIYAAMILCAVDFLKEPFSVDWIVDKPDIQIEFSGIEVTRDMPEVIGAQTALWNATYGLSKEDKEKLIDKRDKKGKFSGSFSADKMSMSFPIYDEEILLQAIEGKNLKYKNYKKFDKNALFIFSTVFSLDLAETNTIKHILGEIEFEFSTIFIKSYNEVFEWNSGKVKHYTLPNNELKTLHERAVQINEKYFDSIGNRKLAK